MAGHHVHTHPYMGSINLIEPVIKKEGMKFGKRCLGSSVEVRRRVGHINMKQGALQMCATFLRIKETTNYFSATFAEFDINRLWTEHRVIAALLQSFVLT